MPQAFPRPSGDPFQEPPEPRPPRGIALDEKLEYFRSVLKLKEETLARARGVYEQRDLEAARLREVAVALKSQLDEVLPQLGQLRYLPARLEQLQGALEQERTRADGAEGTASSLEQQLSASEADRRDLARALAEVEAELPGVRAALDEEKLGRATVSEELAAVKDALHTTEEKARQLEVEKLEAMGSLDAVNGQYQEVVSLADRLEHERDRLAEEVRTLTAERSAASTERDLARGELEGLSAEANKLRKDLGGARQTLTDLEVEHGKSRSSLGEFEGRVRYLTGELDEARQRAQALEESAAQMAEASSEELAEASASLASLKAEKADLQKEASDLPRLRQALEAQLGKVRDLQSHLEEATRRVSQLEDQVHGHTEESAALRGELEAFQHQMQAEEQRARAEMDEAMGREGQARKALETKLAERSQQLQAAQKAEAAARQESESRGERVRALERQVHAEVEKRTQTEAKSADVRRQLEEYQGAHEETSSALESQRRQGAQLEAALGGEEQKRKTLEQKLQAQAKEMEAARAAEEKARAQATQVSAQVQKLQDTLKAEQQKSHSLREQLNAQLAGGSEATIKKLAEELEGLRADAIALKKVREELVAANRKAMESQASFMKEKREREALAVRVSELESRPPPAAPAKGVASSEEVEKLRADVAKLKTKLVAAENAAEAAALLKSKVARLEAQLKKKG